MNPLRGDPLYMAGLGNGARIDSIDGRAIRSAEDLEMLRDAMTPGDTVRVAYEQRGVRGVVPVVVQEDSRVEVVTYESAGRTVTAAMRRLRGEWLSSKAGARN